MSIESWLLQLGLSNRGLQETESQNQRPDSPDGTCSQCQAALPLASYQAGKGATVAPGISARAGHLGPT